MTGELSFFELGTGDYERARAFYSDLFSWDFEPMRKGGRISTPNVPGGIHPGDAGASPYVFFAVDDLDAALAKVRELGGSGDAMDEIRTRPPSSGASRSARTIRARASACTSVPPRSVRPLHWKPAVGVAQLVELLVVVQAVGGSSPLAHPLLEEPSAGRRGPGRYGSGLSNDPESQPVVGRKTPR